MLPDPAVVGEQVDVKRPAAVEAAPPPSTPSVRVAWRALAPFRRLVLCSPRDAENCDDLIYGNFEFKGGPFARLSLSWADVEAAIASFAEKEHPNAVVLKRAGQLASAIGDHVKNSD